MVSKYFYVSITIQLIISHLFTHNVLYRDEIDHKSNMIHADSVVSDTNAFINFCISVHGDTRREMQFLKVFST